MSLWIQKYWRVLTGRKEPGAQTARTEMQDRPSRVKTIDLDLSPEDPLMVYLLNAAGVVEIDKLDLDSPALVKLRSAGVKITVPLVSQGELIGLLNLGPRLSEQEYSRDDHRLLSNLATQAAPALRVAQLARQQQQEARERERIEQELRVARVIQQTLLPRQVPDLPGWQIAAYWQPARAVSGDFYDFIHFPDGKIGLFVGDVTDKGVPAALVMATTRSVLRSAAERLVSPSLVLEQSNELLYPDIPNNMFVTCLYAVLDPQNGQMRFANAGHNLPYRYTRDGVEELRATGMPLGLLPGMKYDEKEALLAPGDRLLVYSDGLVEAHNPQGEMFGFPRLRSMLAEFSGKDAIEFLVEALANFTGAGWEQEDDVTLLTLERVKAPVPEAPQAVRVIAEFDLASEPGNERQAMEKVAQALSACELSPTQVERLKTAVAEGTMNAMEHGNHYQADLPVHIEVSQAGRQLLVRIRDHGSGQPVLTTEEPDLEAKLKGLQSPRGWGLFLIKNMVDELRVSSGPDHHQLELVMNLEGGDDGENGQ